VGCHDAGAPCPALRPVGAHCWGGIHCGGWFRLGGVQPCGCVDPCVGGDGWWAGCATSGAFAALGDWGTFWDAGAPLPGAPPPGATDADAPVADGAVAAEPPAGPDVRSEVVGGSGVTGGSGVDRMPADVPTPGAA